ncbi:hypothetical protein B9Z55_022602 [Caenorhabditis nigoni]|uniref:Uncharacterized protein n=1 Tax=Caenorhabditis nigoni TaxID=1611254 RepID=A0A2G5SKX9_9PELO|nr:hypothetical protein B9Z55_022602 [Caenorhabditis nigoni]
MNVIDEKPEEEEKEGGEMRSESDGEVAVAAKRWTRKTDKDDLQQPICHGWLIVCEGNPTKMMNKEVKLPWHAGYCVFDPRQSTMSCYKQEYPFVTNRLLQRNRTVRMDGDRSAFAKHWGLLPDHFGSPISGPHTIARSYTRHPKERIPTKERFFSISRIPSRLTKFSTVRGVPVEFFG